MKEIEPTNFYRCAAFITILCSLYFSPQLLSCSSGAVKQNITKVCYDFHKSIIKSHSIILWWTFGCQISSEFECLLNLLVFIIYANVIGEFKGVYSMTNTCWYTCIWGIMQPFLLRPLTILCNICSYFQLFHMFNMYIYIYLIYKVTHKFVHMQNIRAVISVFKKLIKVSVYYFWMSFNIVGYENL